MLRSLFSTFIRLVGGALVRTIYRIRTVNPENLPVKGGVLLLPNHVSFADGFFIAAACPRPVCFVMDEAFMARPAIRIFVSIFETVPIRRDQPREAIRITIDALKNGDLVCLFPEGQLTRTGTLCELRRGFELIARKAGHPLVPLWCDGSWGSIFSFEGGRYFKKFPRCNPVGMALAFGPEIESSKVNLEIVRGGLLKASASAQTSNFFEKEWSERIPTGPPDAVAKFRQLAAETRKQMWINGYQIGQMNALQRRKPFHILRHDLAEMNLYGLSLTFPELFRSSVIAHDSFLDLASSNWVGGDLLRQQISNADWAEDIAFYDFGTDALLPLEKPGVSHFPCLAIAECVIAMSMPHPQMLEPQMDYQPGNKPKSWGKLLPGWYLEAVGSDSFRVHGPAGPEEGLRLPDHCILDSEGFLVRA